MIDTKKEYIWFYVFVFIGSLIGATIGHAIWRENRHLCQCEYCKIVRQREALEMVDSVIHDRIVINIEKKE